MKKTIARVAILATIAAAAGVAMATPAFAAGSLGTQSNGSYGPAYIFKSGVLQDNILTPATVSLGWSDNAYINNSSTDITSAGGFACPVASTNSFAFLSAQGDELTLSNWKLYSSGIGNATPAYVNIKPEGMAGGGTETGTSMKAKTGDYSLGVACTSVGDSHVDRVYFRTIHKADGTGAYTVDATNFTYNAPQLGYTEAVANAHPGVVYTGDTLVANFTNGDADVASGFTVTYQFYAGTNPVGSASATNTYLTTTNDAGKIFSVKAIFTRTGYPTVQVQNAAGQNRQIVGAAVTFGDVPASATIYAATNGLLSLSLPGSSITLTGSRDAATNTSISSGTLTGVQVIEGRVVSRDGWDLNVTWTNFVKNDDVSMIIDKKQLGISTAITSSPAQGNVQPGTARNSGDTYATWDAAYQAAQGATNGNAIADTVGTTTLSNTFTLKAPQWKPAGTYNSTVTYTVATK